MVLCTVPRQPKSPSPAAQAAFGVRVGSLPETTMMLVCSVATQTPDTTSTHVLSGIVRTAGAWPTAAYGTAGMTPVCGIEPTGGAPATGAGAPKGTH